MPHPIADAAHQRLGESLQHAASLARANRSLEVIEYAMPQVVRHFTALTVDYRFGSVQKDIVLPYRRGLRGLMFRAAIEGALRPEESPHDLSLIIAESCESMEPGDARQIVASIDFWHRTERALRERGGSAPRGVLVLLMGKGQFHASNPTRPDPFPSISALARAYVSARVSLPDSDMEAIHDRLFGEGGAVEMLQATVTQRCPGRQLLLTDGAVEALVQATQVTPWGRDSAMQVVADLARKVLPVAEFVAAKTEFDIQIEVSDSDQSLRVGPKIVSWGDIGL